MKRFGVSRVFRAALCFLALCLFMALPAFAQTYTVLYNFGQSETDASFPNGELIQDPAGDIYGTTYAGGAFGAGTVFELDTNGQETILYSFTGGNDGAAPEAGLFRDPRDGSFYGTTTGGGVYGLGTVFKLDTSNSLTTLHSFKGGTDGAFPAYRLISVNGELYGTTYFGGGSGCDSTIGCGTIYKITKGGLKSILYRFKGHADGGYPQGLIQDSVGNLYGAAEVSSTPHGGTIFKLDASGVFSVVYAFTGGADGGSPQGKLIRDANGNIHGVTTLGGAFTCDPSVGCGVVFRLDANGNESVLHRFFAYGGGDDPQIAVLDVGGVLYGTTVFGGDLSCNSPDGCGVFFQIGKTGQYTILHDFDNSFAGHMGSPTFGGLTLGRDGNIYGATRYGGTGTKCADSETACGVIFRYTLEPEQ
ncbi:MAG TPA: choice-of-anchor tandem repeat GloVer-containing protein [Verrucomicrobiae bacterium]|nr:choice-of-anchor tandem repeat GloVer-containing protein [Verrucomicrobiae bacterium]